MTRKEIVDNIARNKIVEQIVNKVGRGEREDNLKDLTQDIYLHLLTKYPEEKLQQANEDGTLNYIVARIVVNNIMSKNSRYHYLYRKGFDYNIKIDEIECTENQETI